MACLIGVEKLEFTLRLERDAPLNDGTPRRARGVRPIVDARRSDGEFVRERPRVSSYVLVGPLLKSDAHAERWFAVVADLMRDGRDWPEACAAWRRIAARYGFPVYD
jgi:hypothetical protein